VDYLAQVALTVLAKGEIEERLAALEAVLGTGRKSAHRALAPHRR
jgi:hypothetical protein